MKLPFDEFLESAWNDHAERADEVADRIGAALGLIRSADQVPFFVQLSLHVYGEHLGQWQRGRELLESMKTLDALAGSAPARMAIDRGVASLRYAGGEERALDALSPEDRVRALASASSALAGRGDLARAIASFRDARVRGESGLAPDPPAHRALAAAGNNLACVLEGKRDRSTAETDAMVEAARAALTSWQRAGTWLEEERAEYRLARSLLQAGDAAGAVECAKRCSGSAKATTRRPSSVSSPIPFSPLRIGRQERSPGPRRIAGMQCAIWIRFPRPNDSPARATSGNSRLSASPISSNEGCE